MNPRFSILKARAREHLVHDLGPFGRPVAEGLLLTAEGLLRARSVSAQARGFALLMRLHSGAFSASVDRRVVERIRELTARERSGRPTGLWDFYDRFVAEAVTRFRAGHKPTASRLIGSRILPVKSWRPGERGVLIVDYSYVFPLLAGLFNLDAIAERYTIVLEPSWAGSCTPEILLFTRLSQRVYVETTEPRDRDFLSTLGANLATVPVAANWWVDPREAPPADTTRDIDVIMVAAWADIKRHANVFEAIAALRRRGHRLKVVLVGYPYDRTRAEIEELATHFGIRDQVETFERISQDEIWKLLIRSKVHVLWSRRECANRAIVEAMTADVPIVVREGLTFGYRYPYVNAQTGRFVAEHDLGDAILDMTAHRARYAPRQWMLEHMTARKATAVVEDSLRRDAQVAGEPWTRGLAVKISTLDTQRYLDESDRTQFAADFQFLESQQR